MAVLSIFSKICPKCILFGRYFLLLQTSGVFINVRNMRERQRSSGKFRLHKSLPNDKQSAKNVPHHFRYFHCFNFQMTFDKNLMKKATIFLFLRDFYYVAKSYILLTVGSKIAVLRIITEIFKKVIFCLLIHI